MLNTFRNHRSFASRRAVTVIAGVVATFAIAGCHKKAAAPPPPEAPAATAPQPTATITAQPDSINAGQSVVLTWKTTDADTANIEGIGAVPTAGTRTVNPTESTDYNLTATGAGGNATATARVTVNGASAPSETNITDDVFHQNVKDVFFDYDAYEVNATGQTTIQQDANFLNQHPDIKVVIGGYCDERGSTEYNLALGENRANAAKQALVSAGVSPTRLRTVSYGKEKQFCTEHNESCWQQNRRAQFNIDR